MNLLVARMDDLQQAGDVSRLELGDLAVLEDVLHDWRLVSQLLQHIHRGRVPGLGLLDDRQFQLFKEDVPQLLSRIDIKFLASGRVDLAFNVG